ncbi:MAG: glycosyl transferase group 1 [Fibrobacteres bacterium]|nr:glycosyl transferase group 1 [Fibrobacterota bacterium]
MALEPSRPFIIHTSNPEIGGAEASLLAAAAQMVSVSNGAKPIFLVPAEGSLSRGIAARGWEYRVLPWPRGLAGLTQSRWFALPLVIPGLIPYLFRLQRECRNAGTVWSSGVKSHGACLLLAPLLGSRLLFDIRDFLRPLKLRKAIAWASRRFGCKVAANSIAVAADFPGALVRYPRVEMGRAPVDRRQAGPGGKRIISHLAYFAPYKGQDLFLTCARKLLDAGVDAEFWMIGDVIYPADAYARYRERIYELTGRLRLSAHVRFLGKVEGGEEVQKLLEQTHLLLHCTREPEPFGRSVLEALMCGSEAICHKGSGVAEVTETGEYEEWMKPLREILGEDYIRVRLKDDSSGVGRRASGEKTGKLSE